jgi:subtilisin family serine protease
LMSSDYPMSLTMQKRITAVTHLLLSIFASILPAILIVGVFVLIAPSPLLAQDAPPVEESAAQPFQPVDIPIPPFVPGVVLVGVAGDTAAASASATYPATDLASAEMWAGIEVLAVEPLDVRTGAVNAAGGDGASGDALTGYKLTVPVGTEWAAIETLEARPGVVFAEPDWLAQIAQAETPDTAPDHSVPHNGVAETPFVISDTLYRDQWYIQRIGMSRAWALALQESDGILDTVEVYIIDTGVDFTHPDLAGKLGTGRNYLSGVATAHDDNGHGTHVAGLAAAAVNGTGTVGPGLQVQVVPFKALNANGVGGVSAIGQAIRDAADLDADIINLSLELAIDTFALRSAVEYAVAQGSMIIAASGNQGRSAVSYPAAYPGVLAVGATSYVDAVTSYSNQGAALDLVAPGGLTAQPILSSWTRDVGANCPSGLREVNDGVYCNAQGTSMATGLVSGVAALIMSMRPDLDAEQVTQILLDSAAPIPGSTNEVGRGRLDASQAVRRSLKPSLVYSEQAVWISALQGESALMVTLPFANPSLEPLHIQVTPTMSASWFSLVGPSAGEVAYGAPLEVQLVFSPTAVSAGTFQSSLRVTTTSEGGATSVYFVTPRLEVFPALVGASRHYIAWLGSPARGYSWAQANYAERTNYAIAADSSIVVDLPFTVTVNAGTVNEHAFADLRIFADGFVVGPASSAPASSPNHCLANQIGPPLAIYGWWSDLGVAADSVLSTFQPDADHVVVEYLSFASLSSSNPNERVSFQIVLDRYGQIGLNYAQTPEHAPANLTVGASVEDGLFYNQITCHVAGSIQVGEAPQDSQSFFFSAEDLY